MCIKELKKQNILKKDEKVNSVVADFDATIFTKKANKNVNRNLPVISNNNPFIPESNTVIPDKTNLNDYNLSSNRIVYTKLSTVDGEKLTTSQCDEFLVMSPTLFKNLNTTEYQYIKNLYNSDIYNKKELFFNDRCLNVHGDNGTDITINARREMYNTTVICKNDCNFQGLDEFNYTICNCSSIEKTESYIEENFVEPFTSSTFWIIVCFNQAFDSNYIGCNFGFWVYLIISVFSLILYLIRRSCYLKHVLNNYVVIINNEVIFNDEENYINNSSINKYSNNESNRKSSLNIIDKNDSRCKLNIGNVIVDQIKSNVQSIESSKLEDNHNKSKQNINNKSPFCLNRNKEIINNEIEKNKFIINKSFMNNIKDTTKEFNSNNIINKSKVFANNIINYMSYKEKSPDSNKNNNNNNNKTVKNSHVFRRTNNKKSSTKLFLKNSFEDSFENSFSRKNSNNNINSMYSSLNNSVVSKISKNNLNSIKFHNNNNYFNNINSIKNSDIANNSNNSTIKVIDNNLKPKRNIKLNSFKKSNKIYNLSTNHNLNLFRENYLQNNTDSLKDNKCISSFNENFTNSKNNSNCKIDNNSINSIKQEKNQPNNLLLENNLFKNKANNNLEKIININDIKKENISKFNNISTNNFKNKTTKFLFNSNLSTNKVNKRKNMFNKKRQLTSKSNKIINNNISYNININYVNSIGTDNNENLRNLTFDCFNNNIPNIDFSKIDNNNLIDSNILKSKNKFNIQKYNNDIPVTTTNKNNNIIINNASNSNKLSSIYNISKNNTITNEKINKMPQSIKEISELPIDQQLVVDKRDMFYYIWSTLKERHSLLNLYFYYSITSPYLIRYFNFFLIISVEFALNALFFTDDYIDSQADTKQEKGEDAVNFIYTLSNEFWRNLWPTLIAILVFIPLEFIVTPREKFQVELNNTLKNKRINDVYIA